MSNTLFVGKVYHRFDELPSTNDWAAQIIALGQNTIATNATKTKPPEGTVVRAANQTAGRGQLGSSWHSSAGENLLLSIIFYPTWLDIRGQFQLSMAVALALQDLGKLLVPEAQFQVKWPNDLYLNGRKTAGILIQNAVSGTSLQSAIVGIGLNVNQVSFSEDAPNATSLALALGHALDLDFVAENLFACVEQRYLQLKAGQKSAIKAAYESGLWKRGVPSLFIRNSDQLEFEGVISGVTDQGLLQVETNLGAQTFDLKELRFKT